MWKFQTLTAQYSFTSWFSSVVNVSNLLWIDSVPVETFFFETRPKSKHSVTRDVINMSDAVHVLPKVLGGYQNFEPGFRGGQLH